VTQTKKLPFRQGYGLNDLTCIQVEGLAQRNGNAVSVLVSHIYPFSIDVTLMLPQTQFGLRSAESLNLDLGEDHAVIFARDHSHVDFGR
jgi:hypothetical protein